MSNKMEIDSAYAEPCPFPKLAPLVVQALSNENKNSQRDSKEPCYFIKAAKRYYKGGWNNGVPNGSGIMVTQNGDYFQGTYVNGESNDPNGLIVFANGDMYRGPFSNSLPHGKDGIFKHKSTKNRYYEYKGDWEKGMNHGQGTQLHSDGTVYKGGFVNNLKHGKGVYQIPSENTKYEGEFKQGFYDGSGKLTTGTSVYEGLFKKGKKQGRGTLKNEKGKLTGVYQNGVGYGEATFEYNDGRVCKSKFDQAGKFVIPEQITFPNKQVASVVMSDSSLMISAIKQR